MEIFTNKSFMNKIIIILVIVLLFNFIVPHYSHAIELATIIVAIVCVAGLTGGVVYGLNKISTSIDAAGELFAPIAKLINKMGNLIYRLLENYIYTENELTKADLDVESSSEEVFDLIEEITNEKGNQEIELTSDQRNHGTIVKKYGAVFYNMDEEAWDYAWAKIGGKGGNKIDDIRKELDKAYNGTPETDVSDADAVEPTPGVTEDDAYRFANTVTFANYICWLGPGVIFANKVPLLEVNFINPNREGGVLETTKDLAEIIADWYKGFRHVALVALLSILLYIGIRMMLTSIAEEKAKYKKMMVNWVVAVLMLYCLHYIMLFILTLSEKIIEIFSGDGTGVLGPLGEDKLFTTIRYKLIVLAKGSTDFETEFGTILMYIVLLIWTIMFLVQYIKRVMYMAFFTMVAPLVSITYPLDKIKDGQAQAFSMWLKEYIFNALLPVIHIILYNVFVSSVPGLIETNPLFACIMLGCMIPMEKFVRKMFGFEKASSTTPMQAAAGGAMMMNAVNKMGSLGKGSSSSGASNKSSSGNGNTVRTKGGKNQINGVPNFNAGGGTAGGGAGGARGTTGAAASDAHSATASDAHSATASDAHSATASDAHSAAASDAHSATDADAHSATDADAHSATDADGGKGTLLKNIGAGIGNAGKNMALNAGKSIGNFAKNTAFKLPGAALGATLGIAAGIASGDMSKALTYGTAGATALGNASQNLGNNVTNKAMSIGKDAKEDFGKGYLGTEEYNNRQADKEFYKSKEWQDLTTNSKMRNKFKNVKDMKKAVQVYRDNGITDTKKIVKTTESGLSPSEGAFAIRVADKLKVDDLGDPSKAALRKQQFYAGWANAGMTGNPNQVWDTIVNKLV